MKKNCKLCSRITRKYFPVRLLQCPKTGYFVYCNGNTDKEAFDGRLGFDVKIVLHEGDTSWVEKTILDAIECLKSDKLPAPDPECDFCKYRKAAMEVTKTFENKVVN